MPRAPRAKRLPQLTVIIPVFNEAKTIVHVLRAVKQAQPRAKEIIVVDDCSTDGTHKLLKAHPSLYTFMVRHRRNLGKGAAVRTGFAKAHGEIVLVQDADLEYDPSEYAELIAPIVANQADVVYGSRFVGNKPHRVMFYWHYVANKTLTTFCNIVTNLNLTDMETGFKVIRRDFLKKITLHESGFGFEPELTIKLARQKVRIYEVGIAYHGRTYEEGKKIHWTDAVVALWVIIKYGLF